MNRRRFLGTLGAGFTVGAAGCLSDDSDDASGSTGTPTGSDPVSADVEGDNSRVSSLTDPDLPLSNSDLRRGAAKDAIPAITEPAFASDWSDVDATLSADSRVIGVAVDGEARAYPLAILNWHEVVNDTFGGPLLVTYCPLCGSGVTAERRVNGETTVFGVSGLLWKSDLVMYDELTESLWSQVLGKAVKGPETGTSLALRPSSMTTWGEWQAEYPDTEVLLPSPKSKTVNGGVSRRYNDDPYTGYEESRRVGISGASSDDRLHPKASVIGIATDEVARAYPLETVQDRGGVVNDTVRDLPVVVAATDDGSLVAYERTLDGTTLTFDRDGDALVGGGSRWGIVSGRARDGPHEGTSLTAANDRSQMFWFAWADFYPETEIFGQS